MNIVVADASFCGAWILPDEVSAAAEDLLEKVLRGTVELRMPSLWSYEMANLLKSACRRGRLSRKAVRDAAEALGHVPVRFMDVPNAASRIRILEIALKHDLSAYDAAYLELAQRFKAPLRTADKNLRLAWEKEK